MDDKTIELGLINKEEAIFDEVVQHYSKLVWTVVASITHKTLDKADIEEITSDVFMRLWQSPEKFDSERGSLKNYLITMAKSMALNAIKRHKVNLDWLSSKPVEEIEAVVASDQTLWNPLYVIIKELPEPTREICMQRFMFEQKPREISQQLDVPIKEVRNRLYKGKKIIKRELALYLITEEGVSYE